MFKKTFISLFCLTMFSSAIATPNNIDDDVNLPGYVNSSTNKEQINYSNINQRYTVISHYNYQKTSQQSHKKVMSLLLRLRSISNENEKVSLIANHLVNTPYAYSHVEGEGDWCSNKTNYNKNQEKCAHIQQDPIYRTDQFNCTTLVETTLALLNSNTENFSNTILHIEYGAAGLPYNKLYYCNRNNFVSADFNPINQKNHYIKDITNRRTFHLPISSISSHITPIQWFQLQMENHRLKLNVRVLQEATGPAMVKRFTNHYLENYCPKLSDKTVAISYIPKKFLVKKVHHFFTHPTYQANKTLLASIPTPAVIEIIRNDKKWIINGKPVSQLIGSGLNVSHSGILYRKNFTKNQFIFNSIECRYSYRKKVCHVVPHYCKQHLCKEIMLLAASDAYPDGYHYYKQYNHFVCNNNKPGKGVAYTSCNRVFSMPLADYLVQKEYGYYTFAQDPSVVGIHLEKII